MKFEPSGRWIISLLLAAVLLAVSACQTPPASNTANVGEE
jgi:hypothetical protein